MIAMPGRSYGGTLPSLSAEERELAERLRRHVQALALAERNVDLERPAQYIESALNAHGIRTDAQWFESGGRRVRNIENTGNATVIVGPHYDTVPGSPGADHKASAVAALIELAGMFAKEGLPVRFIAVANQ